MEDICRFLEGRYSGLFDSLKTEMAQAAEDLNFEQAAKLRDRVQALEKLMAKQKVVSNRPEDKDVLAIARNGSEIALQKMEIRQGRLVAAAAFFWPEDDQTDTEVLTAFLSQHYPDAALVPPEILIPVEINDEAALTAYLSQLRGGRCVLRVPRRGRGAEMLQMAGTMPGITSSPYPAGRIGTNGCAGGLESSIGSGGKRSDAASNRGLDISNPAPMIGAPA